MKLPNLDDPKTLWDYTVYLISALVYCIILITVFFLIPILLIKQNLEVMNP